MNKLSTKRRVLKTNLRDVLIAEEQRNSRETILTAAAAEASAVATAAEEDNLLTSNKTPVTFSCRSFFKTTRFLWKRVVLI
jgi:hypothetical protein